MIVDLMTRVALFEMVFKVPSSITRDQLNEGFGYPNPKHCNSTGSPCTTFSDLSSGLINGGAVRIKKFCCYENNDFYLKNLKSKPQTSR